MSAPGSKVRPRPPFLRALGQSEPPQQVEIDGQPFRMVEALKHDSWAATAVYRCDNGELAVCKFHRQQPLAGIPLAWLGRLLARRESHFLGQLSGIPGIPGLLGAVRCTTLLRHAVARQYVPGHPLGSRERVADDFFPRLEGLLAEMHARGIAYVDLHKRENVIAGDDGQPYLIDFQVSYHARTSIPGLGWLSRWVLHLLQGTDDFCLKKLHVRCRPDQAAATRQGTALQPPWWIALHRLAAVPLRTLRRRLLVLLGVRTGRGMADSEQFAEDAFRHPAG